MLVTVNLECGEVYGNENHICGRTKILIFDTLCVAKKQSSHCTEVSQHWHAAVCITVVLVVTVPIEIWILNLSAPDSESEDAARNSIRRLPLPSFSFFSVHRLDHAMTLFMVRSQLLYFESSQNYIIISSLIHPSPIHYNMSPALCYHVRRYSGQKIMCKWRTQSVWTEVI